MSQTIPSRLSRGQPTRRRDDSSAAPPLRSDPTVRARYRATAFEVLMLTQDSPSHPMTAMLEATYTGSLDRGLFEKALRHTLAGHPLLQATIDLRGHPREWTVVAEAFPRLDWGPAEKPLRFPDNVEFLDLAREIGLRVWVRIGEGGGKVVFQAHHACTDGLGLVTFFCDLFRVYDDLARGDRPPAGIREADRLEGRDQFHVHALRSRMRMLWGALLRGRRWRTLRPLRLGTPSPAPRTGRPGETILHASLPPVVLDRLIAAAKSRGATLNDLLMRDLFTTLAGYRPASEPPPDSGLVLCLPVSLRTSDDAAMPAANKLMLSFVRRTPDECQDSEQLLQDIHAETAHIKATQRGVKLLEVLRLAIKLTGGIPSWLLKKSSYATAVMTNLGRFQPSAFGAPENAGGLLQAGGLTIEQILSAPNGQPGTAAVFVAYTYGNKLTIALCHDPHALPRAQAEALLASFVQQLRVSANDRTAAIRTAQELRAAPS